MLAWLREMRDRRPVWWDANGFWNVFRYADVQRAAADPAVFSSDTTPVLPGMERLQRGTLTRMDPPQHHKLRRLISQSFTPRRVDDVWSTALSPWRTRRRRRNESLACSKSGTCCRTSRGRRAIALGTDLREVNRAGFSGRGRRFRFWKNHTRLSALVRHATAASPSPNRIPIRTQTRRPVFPGTHATCWGSRHWLALTPVHFGSDNPLPQSPRSTSPPLFRRSSACRTPRRRESTGSKVPPRWDASRSCSCNLDAIGHRRPPIASDRSGWRRAPCRRRTSALHGSKGETWSRSQSSRPNRRHRRRSGRRP